MKAYYIKQGDAYELPLTITADGEAADDEALTFVEVMLGHCLRKTWPGEIGWDDENGCWRLPLTQEETFAMAAGTELPLDVRVKTAGGAVLGITEPVRLRIVPAQSGVVI